MKIAKGFELKNIADTYVIVPTGDNILDFSALITINETGAFIWNLLLNDADMESVVASLCAEYDVEESVAREDAAEFVNILKENKVLA